MHSGQKTPLSLLDRVQRGDSQAWSEFSGRCLEMLGRWCQRWGLQKADADDLVQDTLLIVLARVQDFQHRGVGSFRSWLRTIAWRCWCDAVGKAARSSRPEVLEEISQSMEARQSLEDGFDQLFQLQLLEQAMAAVKQKVRDSTWEAFCRTAFDGQSADEVSLRTGLNHNAVYAARMRVQRLISTEIKRLTSRQ